MEIHGKFHAIIYHVNPYCTFQYLKMRSYFYCSYERHRFKSHRVKVILHGPGIPGPPVERTLNGNKTKENNSKMDDKNLNVVNTRTSDKAAKSKEIKATLRSRIISSKYTNYNGHNLHDDLAFGWHPGTSEVHFGDHGDYHDHSHEDDDSYVVEHGADIHGHQGWHAGHGENGYGYDTNHNDGFNMNYAHEYQPGNGDFYGGHDHYEDGRMQHHHDDHGHHQ